MFITDFRLACTVEFRLKLEIKIDMKTDLKLIFHLRVWSVVLLIVSKLEKVVVEITSFSSASILLAYATTEHKITYWRKITIVRKSLSYIINFF